MMTMIMTTILKLMTYGRGRVIKEGGPRFVDGGFLSDWPRWRCALLSCRSAGCVFRTRRRCLAPTQRGSASAQ